jgi:hypothetical protein
VARLKQRSLILEFRKVFKVLLVRLEQQEQQLPLLSAQLLQALLAPTLLLLTVVAAAQQFLTLPFHKE